MRQRSAFTLIELLVVISIIALLIALLLPSLGAARKSADHVREAANTNSLVQACIAFATDRKGVLPNGQQGPNSYHMRWANKPQWEILVNDYGLPFEKDSKVFGCSSWADIDPNPFYKPGTDWNAPWIYWGGFLDKPNYKFLRNIEDAGKATSDTLANCFHNLQPAGTTWRSYAPHTADGDRGYVHQTRAEFDNNPPQRMMVGKIDGSSTWEAFDDMLPFQNGSASTFWYAP